ncbi:hypothetical protein ERJ75_001165800 [Trypanosoma vivax]|nr:hypothetical protein TRVL_02573 [Trypanosoma vivax]KAH8609788.1 hypothetical protein ERJ75_001165800 [Trypanosoma vivax]
MEETRDIESREKAELQPARVYARRQRSENFTEAFLKNECASPAGQRERRQVNCAGALKWAPRGMRISVLTGSGRDRERSTENEAKGQHGALEENKCNAGKQIRKGLAPGSSGGKAVRGERHRGAVK